VKVALPECIETVPRLAGERAAEADMGIAPASLSENASRVERRDVEASQVRDLIVDDGKLAVIAAVEQPGLPPLPDTAPDESDPGRLQASGRPAGEPQPGAQRIDPHADIQAALATLGEDRHELPAHGVVGKNVRLQPDAPLRGSEIGKHGVEQNISLDEYPDVVPATVRGRHFACVVGALCHSHESGSMRRRGKSWATVPRVRCWPFLEDVFGDLPFPSVDPSVDTHVDLPSSFRGHPCGPSEILPWTPMWTFLVVPSASSSRGHPQTTTLPTHRSEAHHSAR
jgi:hypothetical protein